MNLVCGTCLLIVLFCFTGITATVRHIGCHKIQVEDPFATLGSDPAFSHAIALSRACAVEWIRQQQNKTTGKWINDHTTAGVIATLYLSGYVNDGDICTSTLTSAISALNNTASHVTTMPGGKLAETIIGLRSACINARNYHGHDLVQKLKGLINNYPIGEFNNFFQYSKAVIALRIYGEKIDIKWLKKIKTNVLSTMRRGGGAKLISDTQAVALLALSKFKRYQNKPQWISAALDDGVKQIDRYLVKHGFTRQDYAVTATPRNLVTFTWNMIAYYAATQSAHIAFRVNKQEDDRIILKNVLTYLTNQQHNSGSFGNLGATMTVLPFLSGRTLLALTDNRCATNNKDLVDTEKIKKFIIERENFTNGSTSSKNKIVYVRIRLSFGAHAPSDIIEPQAIELSVSSGTTALAALRKAAKVNACYQPTTVDTKWGPSIRAICKVFTSYLERTYWAFQVNGKMASVGAGSYIVNNRDKLTFAIKTY